VFTPLWGTTVATSSGNRFSRELPAIGTCLNAFSLDGEKNDQDFFKETLVNGVDSPNDHSCRTVGSSSSATSTSGTSTDRI
jgi:hypothetical protein